MNHPLIPLGDTPKDGDFVRYLDRLTPTLRTTPDGAPELLAPGAGRIWRLPEATRAALGVPTVGPLPHAGTQGAVRPAEGRPAAGSSRAVPATGRRPGADDVAWGAPTRQAKPVGAGHGTPVTVRAVDTALSSDKLPDLAALLDPLRGLIARVLIAIGVVWFLLGGPLGMEPFESSVGVALFLIFGGIFLLRSGRRPSPKA